jgi:hypothetical protein
VRRQREAMKRYVYRLVLGAMFLGADAAHAAEPLRVLFVGNSYTYFNNAPEIFAALARAAMPDRPVETGMVAIPGETLVSLWERSEARRVLRSSKWDYVVLQDQSLLGEGLRDGKFVVNSPSLLHWGVRLFDGEIREQGARTVVLQTWSRRAEPDHQADLDFAYDSVARELRATLAPVARVWQRARKETPGLEFYAPDGSHPSPVGSYLLACTLLSTLLPEVDRDMPSSISGHAVSGAGVVDGSRDVLLVAMEGDQAKQLCALARSVVNEVRQHGGYLNARPPERGVATPPIGRTISADRLVGRWTGELTYYPSFAVLDVLFRFEGDKCQGEVVIQLPDRRQRYEAPLGMCSLSAHTVTFTVVTLPLPFLIDRFTGRLVDEGLVGSVERTGRELTNAMSGVWSLHRRAREAMVR